LKLESEQERIEEKHKKTPDIKAKTTKKSKTIKKVTVSRRKSNHNSGSKIQLQRGLPQVGWGA